MTQHVSTIISYLTPRIEQTKYGVLTEISIMYEELEKGTLPPAVTNSLFLLDTDEEAMVLTELLGVPKES